MAIQLNQVNLPQGLFISKTAASKSVPGFLQSFPPLGGMFGSVSSAQVVAML